MTQNLSPDLDKHQAAERLKKSRIAAGHRSASAAVRSLGLNPSTYRAHENGQNPYTLADARKYSAAFGVSAVWLLTGVADPASFTPNSNILDVIPVDYAQNKLQTPVSLIGEMSSGVWRENPMSNIDASTDKMRVAPIDPRYSNHEQFDLIIRDDHINQLAPKGYFVRCLDLRKTQKPIKEGDYVVIERHAHGGLIEITGKYVKRSGNGLALHNATDNPVLKGKIIALEGQPCGDEIRVIGKILWAYKTVDSFEEECDV